MTLTYEQKICNRLSDILQNHLDVPPIDSSGKSCTTFHYDEDRNVYVSDFIMARAGQPRNLTSFLRLRQDLKNAFNTGLGRSERMPAIAHAPVGAQRLELPADKLHEALELADRIKVENAFLEQVRQAAAENKVLPVLTFETAGPAMLAYYINAAAGQREDTVPPYRNDDVSPVRSRNIGKNWQPVPESDTREWLLTREYHTPSKAAFMVARLIEVGLYDPSMLKVTIDVREQRSDPHVYVRLDFGLENMAAYPEYLEKISQAASHPATGKDMVDLAALIKAQDGVTQIASAHTMEPEALIHYGLNEALGITGLAGEYSKVGKVEEYHIEGQSGRPLKALVDWLEKNVPDIGIRKEENALIITNKGKPNLPLSDRMQEALESYVHARLLKRIEKQMAGQTVDPGLIGLAAEQSGQKREL